MFKRTAPSPVVLLMTILLTSSSYYSAYAQVYPPGFTQVLVATIIQSPTAVAFAPDGRIFVTQQGGLLRVIKNNTLLTTPFTSLSVDQSGERGLVGIALDPDFSTNNYIYLYYTVPGTPAHNRVSRFTANGDVALSGSETIILELDPLSSSTIHNGGAMHFGTDGKLYIAVGENANPTSAQDLDTYRGKLLRINKDGSIPAGNPFTTGSEQRRRIWAYGLRNPFTFAINPTTGRIFVNDVGQAGWEEVNDATTGGRNFGWPTTEGYFNQSTYPGFTNPIHAYPHDTGDGEGCAITGGTFFNPTTTNYPATYVGRYFFRDFCNNWINTLDLSGANAVRGSFATAIPGNGITVATGNDGNLYFLSRSTRSLYKIVYTNSTTPFITSQPTDVSVNVGQPATFQVTASGSAPLSYQWQKNGTNIAGASGATFTIANTATTDNGEYRVVVTNSSGSVTSNEVTLSVIVNTPPVAEIITPVTGSTYVAGTTISFSGKGTDGEDGALPPASLSWAIDFHHNTHTHDQPDINGVASGSFVIPNEGETSANVWYRITLTATDSKGSTATDFIDINPRTSTLNFVTNPPGLQITLDGQPIQTPASVVSVEGIIRSIGTVSPQVKDGVAYAFESWSHGGTPTQAVATPVDNITYTANYEITVASVFYRAINLNGPAFVIDGNGWVASTGAPNFSYTTNRGVFANQSVTLIPSTDANRAAMIRSSIWGNSVNLVVSGVPAGSYQVWLYVWEDNNPAIYSVSVEGSVVLADYNSGPAGTWRKLGPYPVTINDGAINVSTEGGHAALSGIEIWSGQPADNQEPIVLNAIADQSATAGTTFSFTFPSNTFSDPDAGTVLSYSASLTSGNAIPAWLSFNPATRNFSGTPSVADEGNLQLRVTASDGSGGSVSDEFMMTVNPPAAKIIPLITWSNPAPITSGTALSPTQLNATASYNGSPVSGMFTYTPPAGTLLSEGPDQQLRAKFLPANTTLYDTISKTVTIDILAAPASGFYRAINLNGPAFVIDGNSWVASTGAPNFSYTTNRGVFANQSVTLIPSTDANRAAMIRSSIWGNSVNLVISAVPAGSYQVWLYVWEDNNPAIFSVLVEGAVVLADYNSGPAGTWRKLGPYAVTINDGAINVSTTGGHAALSGFEIWMTNSSSAGRLAFMPEEPHVFKTEDNDSPEFLAYPNPFSGMLSVEFTPKESSVTHISIYDIHGVEIRRLFEGHSEAGKREQFEIDAGDIADGVYILELVNGKHIRHIRLAATR